MTGAPADGLLAAEWRALRDGMLGDLADGVAARELERSIDPAAHLRLAGYERLAGHDRRAHERLSAFLVAPPTAFAPTARSLHGLGLAFEPGLGEARRNAVPPRGRSVPELRDTLALAYTRLARDGVEPAEGWTSHPPASAWDDQVALVDALEEGVRALLARRELAELAEALDLALYVPLMRVMHAQQERALEAAGEIRGSLHAVGIHALDAHLDYVDGVALTAAARADEAAAPLDAAARGFAAMGNSGWWMLARASRYLSSVMTHTAPPEDIEDIERELLTGEWRRTRRVLGLGTIASAAVVLAAHGDLEGARRLALSEGDIDDLYLAHNGRVWIAEVLALAAMADGDEAETTRMRRIVDHMLPSPYQRSVAERLRAVADAGRPARVIEADDGIHFEVMRTRWLSLARAVEAGHRSTALDALVQFEEFATRARAGALRVRAVQLFRRGSPGAGGALSTRELEVATLAAEGLTNREIAAELYLGVRTVEGYLADALRTLGLSRREELATFALPVTARGGPRDARLTLRQGQVGTLIAAGASNAEIASALGIGEKTVESHVAVIKARLGVSSRTAIARALAWPSADA